MNATKEQMANAIKAYRKHKKQGFEIIQSLEVRKDKIGETYRQMVKAGFRDEFLKDFDINPEYVEKPSFLADVGAGFADFFGGIGQGARFVADQFTGGNSYKTYTAKKKAERDAYNTAREKSGKGMNVGKFVGENLAMAPALALGKSYQAVKTVGGLGKKAVTAGKITAYNAGVGGALAGVGYQENSDDRAKAMALGAVGGAVAPIVVEPALKLAGKGLNKVSQGATRRIEQATGADQAKQIEIARQANDLVKQGAKEQGIKLTKEQRKIAYNTAKDLLNKGQKPDSNALVRKSVLDSHNIQGTKAQVSGKSSDWQVEREFAKGSDKLKGNFADQQTRLSDMTQNLADSTGQQNKDTFSKMQDAISTMQKNDDLARKHQSQLYKQAREADGNELALDWQNGLKSLQSEFKKGGIQGFGKLTQLIKENLDENGNFTLLGAENVKKALNRMYTNGRDGQMDYGVGLAKSHIDDWVNQASKGGSQATQAWENAKNAYKEHAKNTEMPFFKAVLGGLEPDKAFNKFIVGGNVNDVKNLRSYLEKSGDTQTLADLQGATIEHILEQANKGGNGFSAKEFNKVLNSLNDHKLNALLDEKQIDELKEIGKVADILLNPPKGTVYNSSHTSFADNVLNSALARILQRLPMGGEMLDGARAIFNNRLTKKYLNSEIPTIGKYEKDILKQMGVSDEFMQIVSRPPITMTAIATKQANDTAPTDDYAMPDDSPLWDDDDWQDDEFLANQPADQWQNPFGQEQAPQQGLDFTAPQVADYLPSDFGSYGLSNPQNTPMSDTGGDVGGFGNDMGQPPPTSQESPTMAIQSGLASLIPPPQNPANMGNYESYVQNAVGRIMQTPQMGFILDQMASDNPDFARIEKAQMSLSHTPEWQNFVKNVPKELQEKVHGANILALLTNNQIHGNDGLFNPTF